MCIEAKKGVDTLYWTNYIKFLQNNQHKFAEKWNRFRKNGAGFPTNMCNGTNSGN